MKIYTIGHSRHPPELFLALLGQHGIELLIDVRSRPVSRFAPFANRRALPQLLEAHGIQYLYMGDEIGGKPVDPALRDDQGNPDYGKIAATGAFRQGVEELVGLGAGSKVALMCAEEDPARCHRRLLIGPALEDKGVQLLHIRKDGAAEQGEFAGEEGEAT